MVLPEIPVERRRGREIDPFENGDERAPRADPGELLVRNGEIRAPVRIDVQNIDTTLDERALRISFVSFTRMTDDAGRACAADSRIGYAASKRPRG